MAADAPSPFELDALDAARLPEADHEPALLLAELDEDEAAPELEHQVAGANLKVDALEFREWHEKAAEVGKKDDASRVVGTAAKTKLHMCFLEVTSIVATLKGTGTALATWQIVDAAREVVAEHPVFNAANVAAGDTRASMGAGSRWWKWDGRGKNGKLLPAGGYRSRLTLEGGATLDSGAIELQGKPYHVFIVGEPKADADLKAVFGSKKQYLSNGQRTTRDAWICAFRGAVDPGHMVFLGQGTIEATEVEEGARHGAIGTPHGEYKGWVKVAPKKDANKADVIQIQDLGRTDWRVMLRNPDGPCPVNPFVSVGWAGTYKDGVQAHEAKGAWTTDGTSLGCTTISNTLPKGSCGKPSSTKNSVRSFHGDFGDFGDSSKERLDKGARTPKFLNKQNKRKNADDASLDDGHRAPLLDPVSLDKACRDKGWLDEPLHMQTNFQAGAFGGFTRDEVPLDTFSLADEPDGQIRIRVRLVPYPGESAYHTYHHAVAFGHDYAWSKRYDLGIWVPRKVVRGWNGNRRNVLVAGRCTASWFIEHVNDGKSTVVRVLTDPKLKKPVDDLLLESGGKLESQWTPPADRAGTFFAVFKYKVALKPNVEGADDWRGEPARLDSFSDHQAQLAHEYLVRDTKSLELFLVGENRLELKT
jgi:hypothetical protein